MLDISLWTISYFEENTEQCLNLLNDQNNVEQVKFMGNYFDNSVVT